MEELYGHEHQFGEASVNVKFSREMGCYTWSCIFGCWGFDCESADEAESAFLFHDCSQGR